MPSRENTLLLNAASVAMSNEYVNGRTPVLPAFSMSNVTGCLSICIFVPAIGSSIFGALMFTPGMGPATEGLSGSELLLASHAVSEQAAARTQKADRSLGITVFKTSYRSEDLRTLENG